MWNARVGEDGEPLRLPRPWAVEPAFTAEEVEQAQAELDSRSAIRN